MTMHDRTTYGDGAQELDELFQNWSDLDNVADYAGYRDSARNRAADAAWDAYEDSRTDCLRELSRREQQEEEMAVYEDYLFEERRTEELAREAA